MIDSASTLGAVSSAPASATYDDLHAAFVRYTPAEVAALLTELAGQLRSGRHPAGRPYRHVNGFTKIVVAEHPSARLTRHYWPADPGAPDDVSRPHAHRFGFSSLPDFFLGSFSSAMGPYLTRAVRSDPACPRNRHGRACRSRAARSS